MIRQSLKIAAAVARQMPLAGHLLDRGPQLDLDGKVVFITGAARGLGAEVARQAHARGAYVALVGRRIAPLDQLAAELNSDASTAGTPDRAVAFEADVTDLAALQCAAERTVDRFGGIDVVVANAGIAPPSDTILTIDPDAFEHTVDVDLLGQWRTMRATMPAVIERRGHILVVASIYAFSNGAMNASYAASKAGIEQLTRAARVELAHHGATAGIAYLGFVDTDLAADVFAQEQIEEARRTMPAFFTAAIPVQAAGAALLAGIERRAARVGAPGWVLPVLAIRGIVTTVMDEYMIHNRPLLETIRRSEERDHAVGSPRR